MFTAGWTGALSVEPGLDTVFVEVVTAVQLVYRELFQLIVADYTGVFPKRLYVI